MASLTALRATLYAAFPFPKRPRCSFGTSDSMDSPTLDPREIPPLTVLRPSSLSDRGPPTPPLLLRRNQHRSRSPALLAIGFAKPPTRHLSLRPSSHRCTVARHHPSSAIPPSACFRDRRPPNPAYRSRIFNAAFHKVAWSASIGAAEQAVGVCDVEAQLRSGQHRRRYVYPAHLEFVAFSFTMKLDGVNSSGGQARKNADRSIPLGLSMLTGGLLHSCLHRVGPLPGRAMEERYSFTYLQRTEDDVRMEALPGIRNGKTDKKEVFTSREWLENKFGMLRAKTRREGMEGQKILTGRADLLPQ